MKQLLLGLGKVLLWILLFLGLYVGLSFLLSMVPVNRHPPTTKEKRQRLYVHSNGVHLDLVFPLDLVPTALLDQLPHAPTARLLAFGWGDKGFYLDTPTWAELRPSVAVRAMLLPSPTAMHVTEHRRVAAEWSYVELTDAQLTELWTFIRSSFATDAGGRIHEIVDKGYTDQDRFYEGNGNYSLFKTCNTWVNNGLRRIGVKTALWTPMDWGVLRYLPSVGAGPE